MSDNLRLAQLLFPNISDTPQSLMEERFPPRNLPQGALVTRFAPSPTGFMHLGNVFAATVGRQAAHATGGRFILRIEDTDKKREVKGGIPLIIKSLKGFGIEFDEGPLGAGQEDTGAYGPYIQSKRRDLYHAFCKDLVEKGHAYPCFCTEDEISQMRSRQEAAGQTPGYWGEDAVWRDKPIEDVEAMLEKGAPYVVRLRSPGKPGGRVKLKEEIRGEIEMEENFVDIVLLKSDGIPTYHFAHVVDDTLMRVNQVIRGDEWIASAPIHLQIFWLCGLKAPKYAHISPIMKQDGASRRKLSKRKDPENAATYFAQEGYPAQAVIEYLLSIANSNFEDWRRQNKDAPLADFPFSLKKMSASGALFDLAKLQSVSGGVIAAMTARQVLDEALSWSLEYDSALHALLSRDEGYSLGIFQIDRGGPKPRKDISHWAEVQGFAAYFFDETFTPDPSAADMDADTQRQALTAYKQVLDASDDKDAWFGKIKEICGPLGFCADTKEYKANPEKYLGSVSDLTTIIRVALTGRKNTPDLSAIINLLGQGRCLKRIDDYINKGLN